MKSAGVGLGEDNDSDFWIENPTDAVFNCESQALVGERAYGVEEPAEFIGLPAYESSSP
jgi:hypothetical protein